MLEYRYHTDISVPGIGNGMGGLGDIGIGLNITRYRYRISVSVSVYRYRSNSKQYACDHHQHKTCGQYQFSTFEHI